MNNEASPTASEKVTKPSSESVDNSVLNACLEEEIRTLHAGWRETLRTALDRARKQRRPGESRQQLGRDRSKVLAVFVFVAMVVLLLFFALFSSPNKPAHLPGEYPHVQPNLGQKVMPGRETNDLGMAIAPMLSADVPANDPTTPGQVTAEDIDRTSRTGHIAKPSPATRTDSEPQNYDLSRVNFSDPLAGKSATSPQTVPPAQLPPQPTEKMDLGKPSLVFVRSTQGNASVEPVVQENEERLALPAGTRLLARLQVPVSSAVVSPVVAVVEYNYDRDGQIVMPAGAKVLGRLVQASPSGEVAIQFSRVEMPDGTSEKLDASAMDLNFRPLKGYLSGKKTGTRFLVRSLTGLGTVASYLVGPQTSNSVGLISTNVLMRERLADNVASAGQEQLNGLAFNQNQVVTVPGNTRFYIVLQKPASGYGTSVVGNTGLKNSSAKADLPTLEELGQLMQLRREINDLYVQNNGQPAVQIQQQQ